MSNEEVKTYRCVFFFTDDKYKNTPATNMFVNAVSKEKAESGSLKVFKEAIVLYGIPNANFRQEVYPSSEEEMLEYKKTMNNKSSSNRTVN